MLFSISLSPVPLSWCLAGGDDAAGSVRSDGGWGGAAGVVCWAQVLNESISMGTNKGRDHISKP